MPRRVGAWPEGNAQAWLFDPATAKLFLGQFALEMLANPLAEAVGGEREQTVSAFKAPPAGLANGGVTDSWWRGHRFLDSR